VHLICVSNQKSWDIGRTDHSAADCRISGSIGRFAATEHSGGMLEFGNWSDVHRNPSIRAVALFAVIFMISLLHYQTPTSHTWIHPLLQRAYYIPLLLMAIWYGWRGGVLAAVVTGILYIPHIQMAWRMNHEYYAAQWVEVGMFFIIGALTGVLADHERAQRFKAEQMATQLGKANAELQSSFALLRRADRLSAMGELAAGLAHEIRNPLGAIDGAVQILTREPLPSETKQEFGELAKRELERLKGIVNQFLNFARPQPPRRIAIDSALLLHSVAKLIGETAKMSGVTIRVEEATSAPTICVDPEQVKQVLLNLAINAVQAMPSGGNAVLRAIAEDGSVRLEVQDEGVGIDRKTQNVSSIHFSLRATREPA
jgi:two-component system sensor histidine kinase HydH